MNSQRSLESQLTGGPAPPLAERTTVPRSTHPVSRVGRSGVRQHTMPLTKSFSATYAHFSVSKSVTGKRAPRSCSGGSRNILVYVGLATAASRWVHFHFLVIFGGFRRPANGYRGKFLGSCSLSLIAQWTVYVVERTEVIRAFVAPIGRANCGLDPGTDSSIGGV